MNKLDLRVGPSPQVFQPRNNRSIYGALVLGLSVVLGWGIGMYGIPGVLTSAGGLLGFLLTDWILVRYTTRRDFNVLQSLTYALIFVALLPPDVGFFLAFLGALGGTLLGRWTFGGVGGMWIHPALVGLLFLSLFTSGSLDRFLQPIVYGGQWASPEVLSEPPMINQLNRYFIQGPSLSSPTEIILQSDGAQFAFDQGVRGWLNTLILNPLGINLPGGYVASFFGFGPSTLGAGSVVLVLLVSVYLVGQQVIHSRASFWYLQVVIWGFFIFGGLPSQGQWFRGDMFFFLTSGPVVFTAFFLVSDLSIAPTYSHGQVLYGVLGGLFTLLYTFGGLGMYAAPFSVITVSVLGVITHRYLRPRLYGQARRLEA